MGRNLKLFPSVMKKLFLLQGTSLMLRLQLVLRNKEPHLEVQNLAPNLRRRRGFVISTNMESVNMVQKEESVFMIILGNAMFF